jgi:hypothetical protein
MSLRYPETDDELKTIVYSGTSYEDSPDELPESQLDIIIEQAKAKVELTTESDSWYTDDGLGFALAAYTKMRAKSAVENIGLSNYSLGAEDVSFHHADPDESLQLEQWAEDVNDGLDASNVTESGNLQPRDSAGYVGENYYREERHVDY